MTTAPWPCSTCGAHAVKNLGTRGYCVQHLAAFYRRLKPQVWDGVGIGLPDGPIADDGWTELSCVLCAATWSGAVFMQCPWCATAVLRMREWQAELVLTPPEIDPDDAQALAVTAAWMERLANAVKAGIVTRHQAQNAAVKSVSAGSTAA